MDFLEVSPVAFGWPSLWPVVRVTLSRMATPGLGVHPGHNVYRRRVETLPRQQLTKLGK